MVKRVERNYRNKGKNVDTDKENGERPTDLMDTVLKDKLEYAFKSRRLKKKLLSERASKLKKGYSDIDENQVTSEQKQQVKYTKDVPTSETQEPKESKSLKSKSRNTKK